MNENELFPDTRKVERPEGYADSGFNVSDEDLETLDAEGKLVIVRDSRVAEENDVVQLHGPSGKVYGKIIKIEGDREAGFNLTFHIEKLGD